MSDWEIVDSQNSSQAQSSSDWEVVNEVPVSRQPQNNESLAMAALKAPYRIGEDVYRGIGQFIKNVPGYFEASKTEVPGLFDTLKKNPEHALGQGVAGLAELGQNVFNLPHDIVNYATNRLNLVPESFNQKIQMARMPDSSQAINETFGQPQYPGEALLRGTARNALNLYGAGKLSSVLNPMNLTANSIAKNILKTEKSQIASHNALYNQIWKQAEKKGFNKVPINEKMLSDNLSILEKYKTPREYKSLEDLLFNPTLENAQKAQSDLGIIHRKLEDKSRTSALTSEEKALYNAAKESEKHIESNMFKNDSGKINKSLQNKYYSVTKSYRKNVVPYKYNAFIQAYKNQEMLPNELVNALSHGEFMAKRGGYHPYLGIRKKVKPVAAGIGLTGLGALLYENMMGNKLNTE